MSSAPKLEDLIAPKHTAILTMECQRGVAGDLAELPHLADAAKEVGSLERIGKLCAAARQAGAGVIHSTAENYPGGVGAARNCRLLAAGEGWLIQGSEGVELIPEINQSPSDIVVPRAHGVTPFTSTSLDQVLRNLGVETCVTVGHSVNVGLLGMVLSAVDLGYQVVVPEDAVAGIPVEYGKEVIKNTLWYLATITTTDEILNIWDKGTGK